MQVTIDELHNGDVVLASDGRVLAAVVTPATVNTPAPKPYFHAIGTATRVTALEEGVTLTLMVRDGAQECCTPDGHLDPA